MFKVKYVLNNKIQTRTFYWQKEFSVFLAMLRKNEAISNIEILPNEINPALRKVA